MSAGVSPLTMCGTTSRKRWQTPGAGESAIAGMLAIPVAERTAQYEALGMAPGIAEAVAAAADEAMDRCILALYRSAAQPAMARLSEQLGNAAARPGLVITPPRTATPGENAGHARRQRRPQPKWPLCRGWDTGGCSRIPGPAPTPYASSGRQ